MIPLAENFRSREALLDFVNSVFSLLMREEIGGVAYDAGRQIEIRRPGKTRGFARGLDSAPRAELLLRVKKPSRGAGRR